MTFKFEQGEIVRFEDERFGVGKGGIVGYCAEADVYVIYPKVIHDYENYPFMCICVKSKNIISTPF